MSASTKYLVSITKYDSIPDDGWLHPCILCDNITSTHHKIYTHNIFLCGQCRKNYSKLTILNYIKRNKDFLREI